MNIRDLTGMVIVKRIKLQSTVGCWKADHNFSWDQNNAVDREGRLVYRKIKETIHYLKNTNHINKISYMLPEI